MNTVPMSRREYLCIEKLYREQYRDNYYRSPFLNSIKTKTFFKRPLFRGGVTLFIRSTDEDNTAVKSCTWSLETRLVKSHS